jgi:hypothetical protein
MDTLYLKEGFVIEFPFLSVFPNKQLRGGTRKNVDE